MGRKRIKTPNASTYNVVRKDPPDFVPQVCAANIPFPHAEEYAKQMRLVHTTSTYEIVPCPKAWNRKG